MKRFFSVVFRTLSIFVGIVAIVTIIILASKKVQETYYDFEVPKDTRVLRIPEIDLRALSQEGERVVTDKFFEEKWDMIIVGKMKAIEQNEVNFSTVCFLGIKSGKLQISPRKFETDFFQEIKEISYFSYFVPRDTVTIVVTFGKNWNMTWLFILGTILCGFSICLTFWAIANNLTVRYSLPPPDLTAWPNVPK